MKKKLKKKWFFYSKSSLSSMTLKKEELSDKECVDKSKLL